MRFSVPSFDTPHIISLGFGCAIRTELIRRYFPQQPALFFDYLGNFSGLDVCSQIITNNFQDFQSLDDYMLYPHPKWNTAVKLSPISLCFNEPGTSQYLLASRHFPDLIFYHYIRTPDTVKSFQRKSERLTRLLQNTQQQTIFLYYRQYDEPIDGNYAEDLDYSIHKKLERLESESIQFSNAIEKKYPALQFKLISLIMQPFPFHPLVTPAIDMFLQERATSTTRINFDRVYTSVPGDKSVSTRSWYQIYRKHIVPDRASRLGRNILNIPCKLKKLYSSIKKKGLGKQQAPGASAA